MALQCDPEKTARDVASKRSEQHDQNTADLETRHQTTRKPRVLRLGDRWQVVLDATTLASEEAAEAILKYLHLVDNALGSAGL